MWVDRSRKEGYLMKQSKFNCRTCQHHTDCTEVCIRLKKYLDETLPRSKRVELPIGIPRYPGMSVLNYIIGCDDFLNMDTQNEVWENISPKHRHKTSSRERALLTLDIIGFPRKQIAKLFGIKLESVRRMVYETKKKLGLHSTLS